MYVIKNGTIHVGDGKILDGFDLLIDGKFITKIEKGIEQTGSTVLDASSCEVFPGFIDPNCAIGAMGMPTRFADNCENSSPCTPEMNVKYSIDPDELNAQEFYKSGITTVGAAPGNGNVIGGQIAVCKTAPQKMSQRIVKEAAALKCSVQSEVKETYGNKKQLPKTKMGIFYLLGETIRAARAEKEEKRTSGQKVLCRVFDEENMPVFAAASSKGEIDGILHLLRDEKVKLTLIDGFCFGDSLKELKQNKTGLILGNVSSLSQISKHHMDLSKLGELVQNGNLVAFTTTCGGHSEGREVFLWTAIEVYRAGIDPEEIVKMMTLHPARMLGVDDKVGTLEVGKEADITIFTAHPVVSYAAKVKHSIVNGEVLF